MFGTIGHARLKSGSDGAMEALNDDWFRTIRPKIAGRVVQLVGRVKDRPDETVFVALMQDEATYRNLAADPDQDAWFRRFMELVDGDVTWEDVEIDLMRED